MSTTISYDHQKTMQVISRVMNACPLWLRDIILWVIMNHFLTAAKMYFTYRSFMKTVEENLIFMTAVSCTVILVQAYFVPVPVHMAVIALVIHQSGFLIACAVVALARSVNAWTEKT